ncbi:UNVERIFIED_CONTAM: hypothetical protein Sangu_1802600 [Sesamum angustifolium]|uniref:NHL repeat-containing protein n=1 Tax=Sesamum angustifolium TaxID=2727405 RepID=A0AAW2M9R2_9LAMI
MAFKMGESVSVLLFTLLLFIGGVYSVSAPSSPARFVNRLFSDAYSKLMIRVSSLKATTRTAISGRPMMKFESGYNVETVFDGSKLGIEPYSVEVLPDGNLLILDSANSNIYKISSSLSLRAKCLTVLLPLKFKFQQLRCKDSRAKLVSGSADGYSGHVDGRLREARMNHPKGLTVDDRGNIYIADTDNMAIRKIIIQVRVSTIAGGRRGRGGQHVDGPSEDAQFSSDFDVVYIGSSCSLLVIDRGNNAIREIQLRYDDCTYQYGSGFPLGAAGLIAAGFFGYMLALLQRRIGSIASSEDDEGVIKASFLRNQHQKPLKSSIRRPLIPTEDPQENQEESLLGSFGSLVAQIRASAADILRVVFPIFRNKPNHPYQSQGQNQRKKHPNSWPVQESVVVTGDDEPATIGTREQDDPATIGTRNSTPRRTYDFMSEDSEKVQHLRQSHALYRGWEGDFSQQQKIKKQHHCY